MQIYKRYKKVYVVFLVLCFLAVHRSHAALLNWVVYSEKRKKKKESRYFCFLGEVDTRCLLAIWLFYLKIIIFFQ